MANSIATFSRRLSRSLLSNPKFSQISMLFCTDNLSSLNDSALEDSDHNSDTDSVPSSVSQSSLSSSSTAAAASPGATDERMIYQRPLENGLDLGIYRVDGDGRNLLLPTGGQDSLATVAAHAALLSAANVGAGYTAFVQQKRREAEEKRSSEKKLERRS